ncbi:MAG: pyridoxal phosphate-dependent aminotransferase [bacterium]
MDFAKRTNRIQPSQTLAITALVDSLRRSGKDIVDLGAGEPDFDTPEIVKKAAIQAIHDGFTKYTPASGILELKEAISEKFRNDNNLEYAPSEILVCCGAKHAIINCLLALCQEGDEVIIQAPYWTSYYEQINFVDAKPIVLKSDESTNFTITPGQLREAVSDRTKLLLLNSPSNPTGAVYSLPDLTAIAELAQKYDFYILSDEIYEKIIYDSASHESIARFPELRERVIVVNGVSKAFAMTGWRIGYLAAPEQIVKAIVKVQSHSTSNPCSISQKASIAALKAGDSIINVMVSAFQERRNYLFAQLQQIPGMTCVLPQGAFYMFPNVSEIFGSVYHGKTLKNSMDFCSFLLESARVALVPGEAFGSTENVRISYATSMENLTEAVSRMKGALTSLS